MVTDSAKPKRGIMIDIFLEDAVEKQIKEIQKVEHLKDERDVIYRAIQSYFNKIIKNEKILDVGLFENINKTSFDGVVDFSQLNSILQNIETDGLIERLPQSDIYGLDGAGIIWIFHNRILPVKFTLLCLSKMMLEQNSPWVNLEKLKKYTQDSADGFIDRLEKLSTADKNFGVSVGFPISLSKIRQKMTKKEIDGISHDQLLLSHSRSKKRFSEQFIGRKLRVNGNGRLPSEHFNMGGAIFEMGLIHAKEDFENPSDDSGKQKRKIFVTLTERGQKFTSLKNDMIDFIYGHTEIDPKKIFSDEEKNFYLDEILPIFEFENYFVKNLINDDTSKSSKKLKEDFEKDYVKFLTNKFPDQPLPEYKWSPYTFRIRALVMMARLIEFGIFKKQPGTKSGPYILNTSDGEANQFSEKTGSDE
jgi:hypothetical protein